MSTLETSLVSRASWKGRGLGADRHRPLDGSLKLEHIADLQFTEGGNAWCGQKSQGVPCFLLLPQQQLCSGCFVTRTST